MTSLVCCIFLRSVSSLMSLCSSARLMRGEDVLFSSRRRHTRERESRGLGDVFFIKEKRAYDVGLGLGGWEMCIGAGFEGGSGVSLPSLSTDLRTTRSSTRRRFAFVPDFSPLRDATLSGQMFTSMPRGGDRLDALMPFSSPIRRRASDSSSGSARVTNRARTPK